MRFPAFLFLCAVWFYGFWFLVSYLYGSFLSFLFLWYIIQFSPLCYQSFSLTSLISWYSTVDFRFLFARFIKKLITLSVSETSWRAGESIWTQWITWEYSSSCHGWSWADHKWRSRWRWSWRGEFSLILSLFFGCSFGIIYMISNLSDVKQVETSIFSMSFKQPLPSMPSQSGASSFELDSVLPLFQWTPIYWERSWFWICYPCSFCFSYGYWIWFFNLNDPFLREGGKKE